MGYSLVVTYIILKVLDMVMGLRVDEDEEISGLDTSQHGERAYLLDSGAPYAGIPVSAESGGSGS
jgi:ammonia channel protein AmtB